MISLVMLALACSFTSGAASTARDALPKGGTFRLGTTDDPESIDPAHATPFTAGILASLTCLHLLNYADSPRVRLVPEAAAGFPRISRDGKTYTFIIRKGLRFNTGKLVTAGTFAATINRTLRINGFAAAEMDPILGAKAVMGKRATAASGVHARGNRLVIKLTAPVPEFPYRTATPGFCAVPPDLPIDPEGARAPLPAAGPFYVSSWQRGGRIVLERNRRYGGRRPRFVDRFVIELGLDAADVAPRIERGSLDSGDVASGAHGRLARRYGINRVQYFVKPTALVYFLRLNNRRPPLSAAGSRRAVNFAVDRSALVRAAERTTASERFGPAWGTPTDQWLVPGMPGYRNARIYPFRAGISKARALLGKQKSPRRVTLYTRSEEPFVTWAQLIERDLRKVGLTVTTRFFPLSVLYAKLDTPGEPWDVAAPGGYGPAYPDPASTFEVFEARGTPARYLRLLRRAKTLRGPARERAYAALDVALARDGALSVPFAAYNLRTFVSKRVGCKIFRPELDLAAVCLKR